MPGQLVHTNEILVLLGDNYFMERSAYQAVEIVSRRLKGELSLPVTFPSLTLYFWGLKHIPLFFFFFLSKCCYVVHVGVLQSWTKQLSPCRSRENCFPPGRISLLRYLKWLRLALTMGWLVMGWGWVSGGVHLLMRQGARGSKRACLCSLIGRWRVGQSRVCCVTELCACSVIIVPWTQSCAKEKPPKPFVLI